MFRVFAGCLLVAIFTVPFSTRAQAEGKWYAEARITPAFSGMDQVILDGAESDESLYTIASDLAAPDRVTWLRSGDRGRYWVEKYDGFFTGETTYEAAYAYGAVLRPVQWTSNNWIVSYRFDQLTGLILSQTPIEQQSNDLRWIVLDAADDAFLPGSQHVVTAAITVNPVLLNAVLKTYHSTDGGQTWSAPVVIASGPVHDAAYFGDMAVLYPRAGHPYCFLVYEQGGQLFAAVSGDAGATWGAPQALPPTVATETEVNLAGYGTSVTVVAEGPHGAVLCTATTDAGATWSGTIQIDAPDGTARFPNISRGGNWHAFYRRADGAIAYRMSTQVGVPTSWGAEEVVSVGTTSHPFDCLSFGPGKDVGLAYLNDNDNGCRTTRAWSSPAPRSRGTERLRSAAPRNSGCSRNLPRGP